MSHWGEERVDTSSSEAQAAADRNNHQDRVKAKKGDKTEVLRKKQRKTMLFRPKNPWFIMDLIFLWHLL